MTHNECDSFVEGSNPDLEFEITDPCNDQIVDVSLATAQSVKFSNGVSSFTRTTSFVTDGTDGLVKYKIQASDYTSDLSVGHWLAEVTVTLPGGLIRTTSAEFEVEAAL